MLWRLGEGRAFTRFRGRYDLFRFSHNGDEVHVTVAAKISNWRWFLTEEILETEPRAMLETTCAKNRETQLWWPTDSAGQLLLLLSRSEKEGITNSSEVQEKSHALVALAVSTV